MTENAIAQQIVDAAYRIHTTLGPGLLESVYDTVLAHELARRGLRTTRQQPIPVIYENIHIDMGFRADMIVEDRVIVEIKSVEVLAPVHKKQLLTYLKLADKRLGLLINFNVALIKMCIRDSDPTIEPTNNRAERSLRPAVIARKLSHGSKNERGAEAFAGFTSVIQTAAKKRACSIIDTLQNLFQSKNNKPSTEAHPPPG